MNNSKLILCSLFSVLCFLFLGCRSKQSPLQSSLADSNNFPPKLLGTWKAGEQVWQFTFYKNNKVEIIHPFAENVILDSVKLSATESGKANSFSEYYLEDFSTEYSPDERKLEIRMTLNFYSHLPMGDFSGFSEDVIVGNFDENMTVWNVVWTGQRTIYESNEIPLADEVGPSNLVFKKLSEEELERYEAVKPVAPHPAHD